MSNDWQVYKIINFDSSKKWEGPLSDDGYSLFGIHDREGRQCILAPKKDWVGCIRHGSNALEWSAGIKPVKNSKLHIRAGIKNPSYVSQVSDDYYILSNTGCNQILGIDLKNGKADVLIDLNKHGVVRMLDRKSNTLQTIAGGVEYKVKLRNSCAIRNPYELMLPSICWMDYCQGMLYITDMIGDLIVLAKS